VDQPLPLVLRKKLNELASTAKNEGGTLTRIRSALPQSTPALAELRKKMKAADVRESVALFLRFLLLLPLHTYIFGYGFDKYLLFSNF